ncbi:MAG: hypothetical protein Q9220_001601 [cf. Caloplaca sp. 1 TL-2023]
MNPTNQSVLNLVAQLEKLKTNIPEDEILRQRLKEVIGDLSIALEKPLDTPLQISIGKIAADLGIFKLLSGRNGAMSVDDLFRATGADKALLDPVRTAFQVAQKTDLPAFQWAVTQDSHILRDFSLWMSAQRAGQNSWLEAFPPAFLTDDQANPETPVFVDVGGGIGHQCVALKTRYPELKRRIILQDLPPVIQHAFSMAGIECMPHDFRLEQPIKGASYYYLRNVLHDYPDTICLQILSHLKEAMSDRSALLIDEMILPHVALESQASVDMGVMATLAGKERMEEDWTRLLEQAGLVIRDMVVYDKRQEDHIIVAVLAK